MEIKTLKDLKNALSEVPDDVLEDLGVGITEDGIDIISNNMDVEYEEDGITYFNTLKKDYPVLNDVFDYFDKILEAVALEELEDLEDFISNKTEFIEQ